MTGTTAPELFHAPQEAKGHQQARHNGESGGLERLLRQTPIIPAVRSPEFLAAGTQGPGKIVYFLFGGPENIQPMAEAVVAAGKVPIVNIDLTTGLARDHAAIAYLAHHHVEGIISTHPEPLRAARELGLFAIKRTFLLDSAALASALRSLNQFMPDALEVLPAMAAPHILSKLHDCCPALPVIAGGLVTTLREIENLVRQGVRAVSVSDCRLWI